MGNCDSYEKPNRNNVNVNTNCIVNTNSIFNANINSTNDKLAQNNVNNYSTKLNSQIYSSSQGTISTNKTSINNSNFYTSPDTSFFIVFSTAKHLKLVIILIILIY